MLTLKAILKLEKKITKNARLILNLVNQENTHLTAEDLYRQLSDQMSMATLYNSLGRLVEAGLIRKLSLPGQADHYDRVSRHDHLICPKCGKIEDIHLSSLSKQIGQQLDLEDFQYEVTVSALCSTCRH